MVKHFFWLFISHALLAAPAAVLLIAGKFSLGLAALTLLPTLRVAWRFHESKGYFISGHPGSLDLVTPAVPDIHITRRIRPRLFKAFVIIEVAIVLLIWWFLYVRFNLVAPEIP